MSHEEPPSTPSPDLPDVPVSPAPLGEGRASSVKAASGPIATHTEDLPFPLPPDWFERKAKEQAAAKAKPDAAKAEREAQAAAAAVVVKASAGQPDEVVVRNRPSADVLRSATLAATGEGRNEAYQSHVANADALAAKGQWQEAASAYDASARKAPTPELGADMAAKAIAARSRAGRLRRLVTTALIIGVLCGALGGVYWKMSHPAPPAAETVQVSVPVRPVQNPLTDTLSGADKAKSYSMMVQLRADFNDPDKSWSLVQQEAKAALVQPGVDLPIVKEIFDRAEHELSDEHKDIALIEGAIADDAAGALTLADKFRTSHQRAHDQLTRLPLPGRLMINDPPPGTIATYNDKAFSLATVGTTGATFCRDGHRAGSVLVRAPGYISVSIDIPADATNVVKVVRAEMIEQPVWTAEALAEAPTILNVGVSSSQVVLLEPHSVRTFNLTTGHLLSTLAVNTMIPGMPAGTYTWNALLETTETGVLLSTSTGALCSAALTPAGLDKVTLVTNTQFPAMSVVHGELVYRLNAPAQFITTTPHAAKAAAFGTSLADRLKIKNISEVYAISEGKQLWNATFTGILPLFVLTHGEHLVVIDETAIHILDQESKELKSVKLASARRGPVQSAAKGTLLLIPVADGTVIYRDTGGSDYKPLAVDSLDRLAATNGDQIFALRVSTLSLLKASATGVANEWSSTLPGGMQAVAVGFFGLAPWFLDSHSQLHAFDGNTHHEQRRLRITEGAMIAPTVANDHLVIVDPLAGVKCYLLSGPQATTR